MTNPNDAADLQRLADLIRERNANEVAITGIVGRPAQLGHIEEYIASRIFDIELEQDAAHRGSNGQFRSGQLAGKSVAPATRWAFREGEWCVSAPRRISAASQAAVEGARLPA